MEKISVTFQNFHFKRTFILSVVALSSIILGQQNPLMIRASSSQDLEFDGPNYERFHNSSHILNNPKPRTLPKILNDSPTFVSANALTVNLNEPFSFDILVNDPDGEKLTISASNLPNWITSSFSTGEGFTNLSKNVYDSRNYGSQFATNTTFLWPTAIAPGPNNSIYISTTGYSNAIYSISQTGIIDLVAGDPGFGGFHGDNIAAKEARMDTPLGLVIDSSGNIYFTDNTNSRVRKIDTNGVITTVAGTGEAGSDGDNGSATNAKINAPFGLAIDSNQNLYIGELYKIRKVDTNGIITTFAGTGTEGYSGDGGAATAAKLAHVSDMLFDSNGNLIINDRSAFVVRKIDTNGIITTIAGVGNKNYSGDGGAATSAEFNYQSGIALDSDGNLYIADTNNYRIRKIDTSGVITTIAGTGQLGYGGDGGPAANAPIGSVEKLMAVDGNIYFADITFDVIRKIDVDGNISSITKGMVFDSQKKKIEDTPFYIPRNMDYDSEGNLFVAEQATHVIRKVDLDGNVTVVAGNGSSGYSGDSGLATNAQLSAPRSVAVDGAGNLFISDYNNYRIRKVDTNGIITTIAGTGESGYSGDGGAASSAKVNRPYQIDVDSNGNIYFVSIGNNVVRKIDPNGNISTIAGTGESGYSGDGGAATSAKLDFPVGIGIYDGNIFISDYNNHRIRKIDSNGIISTIAGDGTRGFSGDGGVATSAALNGPGPLAIDQSGNIIFSDISNRRFRKITTNGKIITIAGNGVRGLNDADSDPTKNPITSAYGIAVDKKNNIAIADSWGFMIRKLPGNFLNLSGTPTINERGSHVVSLAASDPSSAAATQNLTISVADDGGKSLSFDGNDFVDLTMASLPIQGDAARTISAWVKTTSDGRVISTGQTGEAQAFNLVIANSGYVGVMGHSYDVYPKDGIKVNDDKWHHIVATYDTGKLSLYVDGSLDTLATATDDGRSLIYNTTGQRNFIAKSNHVGSEMNFSGSMDEVAIWNKALSGDEVAAIFNGGVALDVRNNSGNYLSHENLTAYYKMEEGSGSVLTDLSGRGVFGSIDGASWQTGKQSSKYDNDQKFFGGALAFDGVDDNVLIPHSEYHNFSSGTIMAYLKIDNWNLDRYQRILSKKTYWEDANGFEFEINAKASNNGDSSLVTLVAGGNNFARGAITPTPNWFQVAAVFNDDSARIFFNGRDVTIDSTIGKISFNDLILNIGTTVGGQSPFDGMIDEVAIWNRPLTNNEILTLYNYGNALDVRLNSKDYLSSHHLISYYKMEGSGNKLEDMSGYGLDGTLYTSRSSNSVTKIGKMSTSYNSEPKSIGYSLSFDDTAFVDLTSASLPIKGDAPRTISAWIKTSSDGRVVSTGQMKDLAAQAFNLVIVNNGHVGVMGGGHDVYPSSGKKVNDNKWHHIAAAYENGKLNLFVDGNLDTSSVTTSYDGGVPLKYNTAGQSNFIAKSNHVGAEMHFNGNMDEVAIWNLALNPEEIFAIYNEGFPLDLRENEGKYQSSNSLVAYYKMEDNGGSSLTDLSGYYFDGTLQDSPNYDLGIVSVSIDNTPKIIPPKMISSSLAFDNSSIQIEFNKEVFGSKTPMQNTIEANDFTLSISGGTAKLRSETPKSISIDGLRVNLAFSLNQMPNGDEILTVSVLENSIFDKRDLAALSSENQKVNLNLTYTSHQKGSWQGNALPVINNFEGSSVDTNYWMWFGYFGGRHYEINGSAAEDSAFVNVSYDNEIYSPLGGGSQSMRLDASVHRTEDWGGFSKIQHVHPDTLNGYYDWSNYDTLSFQYYIPHLPSNFEEGVELRFNIMDHSNVETPNYLSTNDLLGEYHYSFITPRLGSGIDSSHFVDPKQTWATVDIPLKSTSDFDSRNGFNLTNWAGIAGNMRLDKKKIKGWSFEFSVNAPSGGPDGKRLPVTVYIDNLILKGLDTKGPTLEILSLSEDNKTLKAFISEAAYDKNNIDSELDANAFELSLSGGRAELKSQKPLNVTSSGYEYVIGMPEINGIPTGLELLTINFNTSEIIDAKGNQAGFGSNNSVFLFNQNNKPKIELPGGTVVAFDKYHQENGYSQNFFGISDTVFQKLKDKLTENAEITLPSSLDSNSNIFQYWKTSDIRDTNSGIRYLYVKTSEINKDCINCSESIAQGIGGSLKIDERWYVSSVSLQEDSSSIFPILANDIDGDEITFAISSDTSGIEVKLNENIVNVIPKKDWNGIANLFLTASDGFENDSIVMPIYVMPVQDPPQPFEWVSDQSDTIIVNSNNITSSYSFNWTESVDVDDETINYLLYAKVGQNPFEIIRDSSATLLPISYTEFAKNAFEDFPMLSRLTVAFTVEATDGIDTIKINGDNRIIYIDRYDYLSTLNNNVPTEYALHDNYPNPFNPVTNIRFDLPEAGDVKLSIFNMLGQKIREYNITGIEAGFHSISWDATNKFGDPVSAGVYLYQLQTNQFIKTKKMILLK